MTEPERRRRRPPLACVPCRNRKTRCDRGTPCSHCLKSRSSNCVYTPLLSHLPDNQQQKPAHHGGSRLILPSERGKSHTSTPSSNPTQASPIPSHTPTALTTSLSSVSTHASQPLAQDIISLKARITQLEEQFSQVTHQSPQPTGASSLHANEDPNTPHDANNFSIYKTRVYGQSHWYSGATLCQDLFEGCELQFEDDLSMGSSNIRNCKSLARIIKSQRMPAWLSAQSTDVPPKHISDELVDCYLRTTETVYRVLHIPSFKRDYDAFWMSDIQPDSEFYLQLKLVLSIGAVTHDDNFSLRTSAIHWVHEAHSRLSQPLFKSRLNIQSLQTNILLLIAREAINYGGELVWISAGALLRTAVCMGLHRDPTTHLTRRTTFATEMRRRLWNTIIELNLQSSIISGGSPFISLEDFNTEPPGNFDDEQLATDDLAPVPTKIFTQTSTAIVLRETLPLRLSIIKHLNGVGCRGTYEETLRQDKALRDAYKILRRDLQARTLQSQPLSSQFGIEVLDLIINHYLSSLHIPFIGLAVHETAYAFSRKVVLDSSLKIWYLACPPAPPMTEQPASRNDMNRFTICGSGTFHTATFQAALMISVELKNQLREEEGMGSTPLRPDLLSVLSQAETWSLRCVEAGETNIKTFLLMKILLVQIKRRMRGFGTDKSSEISIVAGIEEAQEICLAILKSNAARGQTSNLIGEPLSIPLNVSAEIMNDWDLTTADDMFSFGGADPMSWLFNRGNVQEESLW